MHRAAATPVPAYATGSGLSVGNSTIYIHTIGSAKPTSSVTVINPYIPNDAPGAGVSLCLGAMVAISVGAFFSYY